ncbi:MAG: DUF1579 domain-containing protein [Pirellulales bacterium]
MQSEPQAEHRWLARLVGQWTFEHEASMAPGDPPIKASGTETVRSLGGLWTIGEGEGSGPDGGIHTSIMTLGYDPAKQRFVGSFIASMMTHFWLYDGALDAAGKVLTLDSEGPNFTGDGMARYQDIIEFVDDDHRTLSSQFQNSDGTWSHFMTAHYRRRK